MQRHSPSDAPPALSGASSRPSRPATADAGGYAGELNLLQDEDHLIECDNILVR